MPEIVGFDVNTRMVITQLPVPVPNAGPVRNMSVDPDGSALSQRMSSRDLLVQMPPLATETTDDAGLASVAA